MNQQKDEWKDKNYMPLGMNAGGIITANFSGVQIFMLFMILLFPLVSRLQSSKTNLSATVSRKAQVIPQSHTNYCKDPKNSDTQKNCCNYSNNGTV